MNWQKIDAPLAAATQDAKRGQKFLVFLTTKKRIFTGTFSVAAIKELTDQGWVELISLSQELSLL